MPFGIQVDIKTGKSICPCCNDMLWHCKSCWNKYHNSINLDDYIEPKYYGQSMIPKKMRKGMLKEYGKMFLNPSIKINRDRKYKEGEYH